jgi:hypothetical protein
VAVEHPRAGCGEQFTGTRRDVSSVGRRPPSVQLEGGILFKDRPMQPAQPWARLDADILHELGPCASPDLERVALPA